MIYKKTINEAIAYHKEFAADLRQKTTAESEAISYAYKTMAEDEDQLAEWLTQLKEIKEAYEGDYQVQDIIELCVKFWG